MTEGPSILLYICGDKNWSRDKLRDHHVASKFQTSFEINSCPVIYGTWTSPSYGWDAIPSYLALEQLPRMVNSKTHQCCARDDFHADGPRGHFLVLLFSLTSVLVKFWVTRPDTCDRTGTPRRERLEESFEINSCLVIHGSCPGDPPQDWDATPGYLALYKSTRTVNKKTRETSCVDEMIFRCVMIT